MQENQTQFMQDESLRQDIYAPHEPESENEKKPFLKTKKGIIIIGLIVLLLILLGLVLVSMPKKQVVAPVQPSPTPILTQEEKSGLEKRVDDLEVELQRADPTDTVLPFPAVDMNIELEQAERR